MELFVILSAAAAALLLLLAFIILAVFMSLHFKATIGICKCSRHMVGKVVIVTGAHCGLGYATARDLADRGARVIITSIDNLLGMEARDTIIKETGNQQVLYYYLNLTSFASIRKFVDTVLQTEQRLDVLINNAGIFLSENVKTEDGLLQGLQINYFGPFLLTQLLLPLLKSSAPSRIVNVASIAFKGKLNLKDLNLEKIKFTQLNVYETSKLYAVAMTMEMARRLENAGVTVNCLHTGAVQKNIIMHPKLFKRFLRHITKYYIKTPWEGAQTAIYLAVSPEFDVSTGNMYRDCNVLNIPKQYQSEEVGKKLWDLSNQLVNFHESPAGSADLRSGEKAEST